MATTIKLKNGSGAPLAGDLVQGEPALDLTNKRLYTEDSGGSVIEVGTNPSTLTVTGDLAVDTNTLFVDASTNRVGINTDTPDFELTVGSAALSSAINFFASGTAVAGAQALAVTGDDMFITTNSTERMRIDSSGNVGIGTASPNSSFDVSLGSLTVPAAGASTSSAMFGNSISSGGYGLQVGATSGGLGYIQAQRADGTASVYNLTIQPNGGNVGIGTSSPSTALAVCQGTGTTGFEVVPDDANSRVIIQAYERTGAAYRELEYDGSSHQWNTSAATRMTLDSSGNLGIGTVSPSLPLEVNGVIESNAATNGVRVKRGSSGYYGEISVNYVSSKVETYIDSIAGPSFSGEHVFRSSIGGGAVTERMRIDSSGNLLVGKTSADSSLTGVQVLPAGDVGVTRDGSHALLLNRLTSDGDIALFRKDGTTVGSIGADSNGVYIGTDDAGIFFNHHGGGDLDAILPYDVGTNTLYNGHVDIGGSSNRFKNLYLSGGAYLGGTAAANQLDDYEEGAFTPTLQDINGNAVPSYYWRTGTYTKIGKVIHISIAISPASTSGVSGDLYITGLPFVAHTTSGDYQQALPFLSMNSATKEYMMAYLGPNSTQVSVMGINGNGLTHVTGNSIGGGSQQVITGTYLTN
jgi:hypothetical protein